MACSIYNIVPVDLVEYQPESHTIRLHYPFNDLETAHFGFWIEQTGDPSSDHIHFLDRLYLEALKAFRNVKSSNFTVRGILNEKHLILYGTVETITIFRGEESIVLTIHTDCINPVILSYVTDTDLPCHTEKLKEPFLFTQGVFNLSK
jgi:hypothetical protein